MKTKLDIELTKAELKELMVHGELHIISKNIGYAININIKLLSRSLIPPNKIDEVFPL